MSSKSRRWITEAWERVDAESGSFNDPTAVRDLATGSQEYNEHPSYPKDSVFVLKTKRDLLDLMFMRMLSNDYKPQMNYHPRPTHIVYNGDIWKLRKADANNFRYEYVSTTWSDTSKDPLPAGGFRELAHGMRSIKFEIIRLGHGVEQYTDKGIYTLPNFKSEYIDMPVDGKGNYAWPGADPSGSIQGINSVPLMITGSIRQLQSIHKQYMNYTRRSPSGKFTVTSGVYWLLADGYYFKAGDVETRIMTTIRKQPPAGWPPEDHIGNEFEDVDVQFTDMVEYEAQGRKYTEDHPGTRYYIGSAGVIMIKQKNVLIGEPTDNIDVLVYEADTGALFKSDSIEYEQETF
tara:strand:- start:67 stop:1107 length:1041 start_codon:yes stop_codon:yes gene_type:complete